MVPFSLYGQSVDFENSKTRLFSSTIYGGYMFGGQFYNDHLLYNPGFVISFSEHYHISDSFEAGIGGEYISLKNERFIPLFGEVMGYTKKRKNTSIIRFQLGRTMAWYQPDYLPAEYSLKGGAYFSAGIGRQIQIRDHISALFLCSLKHFSSSIYYESPGENSYHSQASYDIFELSIGFKYF